MTLLEIFCCYLVILLMLLMTSIFAFDIVPYANMHVKIQNRQDLPVSLTLRKGDFLVSFACV